MTLLVPPPGFWKVEVGRQMKGQTLFQLQVDVAWNKVNHHTCTRWFLTSPTDGTMSATKGCSWGLSHSAVQAEALACYMECNLLFLFG